MEETFLARFLEITEKIFEQLNNEDIQEYSDWCNVQNQSYQYTIVYEVQWLPSPNFFMFSYTKYNFTTAFSLHIPAFKKNEM